MLRGKHILPAIAMLQETKNRGKHVKHHMQMDATNREKPRRQNVRSRLTHPTAKADKAQIPHAWEGKQGST